MRRRGGQTMLEPFLFPESARYCYVRTDETMTDLLNYNHLSPEERSVV